jgi:hypothetical protein
MGTLHILRIQQDKQAGGVYDATFTDDARPEPEAHPRIRRFFGEQELTEFLKKELRRDPAEVLRLVEQLQREGRARISGLSLDEDDLRNLELAA